MNAISLTTSASLNGLLATCNVCGTQEKIVFYSVLPPKYFNEEERDTRYFICKKCADKLKKLMFFVEREILKQHSYCYKKTNFAFVDKRTYNPQTKRTINIKLNFSSIFSSKNKKKIKCNNGHYKVANAHCIKCGLKENITAHHILKRIIFGENGSVIMLCARCHQKIEDIIREMEKKIMHLIKEIYFLIFDLIKNIKFKKNFKLRIKKKRGEYIFSLQKIRN